jgi:enoyl-CoA hydratase/carnithine racemase
MTEDDLQTIRRHREGPVLRLTLDRPEVLNAINGTMLLEIRDALAAAAVDRDVRVILIDAAGDRAFSAGIDVPGIANH